MLGADVLIAGDGAAATGFVTGHAGGAANGRAGYAGTAKGVEARDLGGATAGNGSFRTDVLITGELQARTGLIASDLFAAAHHDAGDSLTAEGDTAANLGHRRSHTTAIGRGLISADVFGAGDGFTGTGLIAGDLLAAAHFITGHSIAMAGGGDAHLGRLLRCGLALAEGLEHLSTEVFSTGDRTAGGSLVAGGLDRTVGLGAGHGLTAEGLTGANFPMGISGSGLLGAMAIGAGGPGGCTSRFATEFGSRTTLAAQFTHLERQLTAAHIRVALASNRSGTAGLRGGCRFASLGLGFPASQHQRPAGVVLSSAAGGGALACGGFGVQAQAGGRRGCRCRRLCVGLMAITVFLGCSRGGSCGFLFVECLGAVAITAGISSLAAT